MRLKTIGYGLAGILALGSSGSMAAGKLRFWNQTTSTIVDLRLAKAGTDAWGPNQCENDKDKSVDSDERLDLTGIEPGRYDVKLVEKSHRRCLVRGVEVKAGGPYAFAIAQEDLKDCQ